MTGFFLIKKPTGMTSHDVIDRLRKITGEKTIGHAGTLDPAASGLLIIAIGREYTKKIQEFVGLDKEYEAEVTLGKESSTYDAEGEIIDISNVQPNLEEVKSAIQKLTGTYEQMPPIYSAKKIKGKKAYELARKGQSAELTPKKITVFDINFVAYDYPVLKIKTKVSSGTYIRSLAHDLGKLLKTGAYLSGLERTSVGTYFLSQAANLESVEDPKDLERAKIDL